MPYDDTDTDTDTARNRVSLVAYEKVISQMNTVYSRLVASENHYASFRVACRCNDAFTCRGIRTARRHHKSIMAISAAIKSLQLLERLNKKSDRLTWPAGDTSLSPSFISHFYYTLFLFVASVRSNDLVLVLVE